MHRCDWTARAVDLMVAAKRAGETDFDRAFGYAIGRVTVPAADAGGHTPTLFGGDQSVLGFFRRACEAAWHDTRDVDGSGNGRAVREFRIELLADLQLTPAVAA